MGKLKQEGNWEEALPEYLTKQEKLAAINKIKNEERQVNRRNLIRSSLLTYLQSGFPYKLAWQHPLTRKIYKHAQIEVAVRQLRDVYPNQYKVLWAVWQAGENWLAMSVKYDVNPTQYHRKFHRAVDHIMTYLLYPELDAPKEPLPKGRKRGITPSPTVEQAFPPIHKGCYKFQSLEEQKDG